MLIFRKIQKKQVTECIGNPDAIFSTRENKKIYLKDFGNNFLKLIVAEEGEDRIIVTLHWLAKKRVKA